MTKKEAKELVIYLYVNRRIADAYADEQDTKILKALGYSKKKLKEMGIVLSEDL